MSTEAFTEYFHEDDGSSSAVHAGLIKDWYPWIIAWDYVAIIAGIPGNVLTLVAYKKFPSLQTPTNLIICNQSIADICSCIFGQIFVWFNYTSWGVEIVTYNKYACLFSLWFILLAVVTSLANILALSTERLLAIAFPYHYLRWMTPAATKRAIAFIWTVVLVINSLPLLGWNTWTIGHKCMTMYAYPKVYSLYLYLIPGICTLILTAIFNIVICGIAVSKRNTIVPLQSVQKLQGDDEQTSITRKNSTEYKITKMFLTVVGVFYASWMPYLVLTILFFVPPASWQVHGPPEWIIVLHELIKPLLVLNGALNPLIYACKNRKFRYAFRKLLGLKGIAPEYA